MEKKEKEMAPVQVRKTDHKTIDEIRALIMQKRGVLLNKIDTITEALKITKEKYENL